MANNTVFFPGYSAGEKCLQGNRQGMLSLWYKRLLLSVMKFLSMQQKEISGSNTGRYCKD